MTTCLSVVVARGSGFFSVQIIASLQKDYCTPMLAAYVALVICKYNFLNEPNLLTLVTGTIPLRNIPTLLYRKKSFRIGNFDLRDLFLTGIYPCFSWTTGCISLTIGFEIKWKEESNWKKRRNSAIAPSLTKILLLF